tara:strand:- start:228 stop:1232 length:1005 start_codon:yes stop_codon:yes gene_type:complete
LLNIKNSNYFILKKSSDLIDPRSKKFFKLNCKNLSKSVNFVRSTSLVLSLNALFKLKNIIIINSIHDLTYFKNKILFKKKKLSEKEYSKKIYSLMNYLDIKKFSMIDDYRLMELFLPICNNLNIFSQGFMHGRISNKLKYQNNLKTLNFSRYYVWNNYFKKKILSMNQNYKPNQIEIKNVLIKYNNKNLSKKKGIMIVEEDGVNKSIYKKIIKCLKKNKEYCIYFKHRPNNKIDCKFDRFLSDQSVFSLHKENVYKSFKKFNIKMLLGFNSSLLVECSYYEILPVIIINGKNEISDLIKDGLFHSIKIQDISKNLSNLNISKKEILKIKKKTWE